MSAPADARRYRVVGDWGTSRLRLYRIEGDAVVDRCEGPGIAALGGTAAQALRAALAPWRADGEPRSIRLGGMVGSRNGWIEVPYVPCPASADAWQAAAVSIDLDGVRVDILAGLATDTDVMRGEETQIFGALARDPALGQGSRTIVLPGTHSKWTMLADGRVMDFRTFPTGELFGLLRDHSTLARPTPAGDGDPADEPAGFAAGLARAQEGAPLLGSLFAARTMQLRQDRSRHWALGYLSGLIIGSEVAEAAAAFDTAQDIALVGDPALVARYDLALAGRGIATLAFDGDACALAGLALKEALS